MVAERRKPRHEPLICLDEAGAFVVPKHGDAYYVPAPSNGSNK